MAINSVKAGYWLDNNDSDLPASDIEAELFTHLFCGYAGINLDTFEVTVSRSSETFSGTVKGSNPDVKTLLSIGGEGAPPESFAVMAAMPKFRESFIRTSIISARENSFDGLDFQWLYPSSESGMENLNVLLDEWHSAIAKEAVGYHLPQLLLVATVFFLPCAPQSNRYPVEAIRENLDWVNMITYDFITPALFRDLTAPPSAFKNPQMNTLSGYHGIKAWIGEGLPAEKIVFGIPFHGWAWKLQNSEENDLFSAADGPAQGIPNISSDGFITYSKIKEFNSENHPSSTIKEEYPVIYVSSGTTWIGYDNEYTIKLKIREAKDELKLLGYFAWNIANDDKDNTLAEAAAKEWGAGKFSNFLSR